ncbi:restriction endonuclease subunit S, partial [Helicobacter sp. T3_23-1059]
SPSLAEGARGWVEKYPHLNLSIRPLSQSYGISGRLDSEYYQTKYDAIERKIKSFDTIKLKDLVDYPISSGATPKAGGDDYTDSNQGIPFLRAVDLKNSRVETANFIYIKPQIHKTTLKRTQLQNSDVLFSIAGTIGRCAIFDYDFEANINQALCILRFAESRGILRLYLITFFNSKIGQVYLEKYSRQGLQTNL